MQKKIFFWQIQKRNRVQKRREKKAGDFTQKKTEKKKFGEFRSYQYSGKIFFFFFRIINKKIDNDEK
jgi:hypothetical protein